MKKNVGFSLPLKPCPLPLFFILALAFGLRLTAIQFGLPHLYHADEPIVVNHALAYGTGDLHPHFFKIPPLVSYLLFIAYGIYFLIGKIAGAFPNVEAFEQLFYTNPSSFYLLARFLFGALFGSLTVLLLYQLIHRHFGKKKALLSSFFLAVCFLHVRDSHYVYADIPLVFVLVLTFGVLFLLADHPGRMKYHLWAGSLIGLATAVKYNGIALAIPYIFVSVVAGGGKKKLFYFWLLAFLASSAVFIVLNPYAVLDFNFFLQEIRQQSKSHVGGVGWLYHLNYSLSGGMGWPLLLAAGFGLALFLFGWIREPKNSGFFKKATLLVFIFGYYLILVFESQPYERYVLPLLPFVLFFAADFVVDIVCRRIQNPERQKTAILLLGLVLASPTLLQSILFDRVMLADDTRTLAKEWIEKNIPSGSPLALDLEFYMPRLNFSKNQLEQKKEEVYRGGHFAKAQTRKLDFLLLPSDHLDTAYELYFLVDEKEARERQFLFSTPTLPFEVSVLKSQGIQYAVAARLWEKDIHQNFYDELKSEATLVIEFNPYRHASRQWPYTHPLTGGPFLFRDLLGRERNGQPIKIYKLKPRHREEAEGRRSDLKNEIASPLQGSQ